jgi:hypothetical protein
VNKFMTRPGLADQGHLLHWADAVTAQSELPRLIRRLILETGGGVVQIGFAAGSGVAAGGWDGTVLATEGTAFIPEGLSLWEISAGRNVSTKPDIDFDKRRSTPDGSPTESCTFIEVILRRWARRAQWARDKAELKRWKNVAALGVDGVETWLEDAPVTHAWISDRLGLAPYGIEAAETWWESWSQETSPKLPPAVVMAGREQAAQAFRERIADPAQITTISAASEEDVLAFVAAFAHVEAAEGRGVVLSRTAFVDDMMAWRALRDRNSPLILLPRGEARAEARPGSAHHIVVPLAGSVAADVVLQPLDAEAVTTALRDSGLEHKRADEAGHLARRSLKAMRRRLATKPELHRPSWAQLPVERLVLRALLAGRWNDRHPGDRQVVADLAGTNYEDLRDGVERLATNGDPYVSRVDQSLGLVSPVDAWMLLGGTLRDDDLQRFEGAVAMVLLALNPALELPAQERWRAAVLGKSLDHSRDLRRGIATSLTLLAVHGEHVALAGGATGTTWVTRVVWEVLARANDDASCKVWASLEDVLPLLAEAAPNALLDAVRVGVTGEEPLLLGMFTDDEDATSFGLPGPHMGLLWALERLAWSPDHFGAAVDVLARLAELDPGGRSSNRPSKSLVEIFCPWYPNTAASVRQRLDVLTALRQRHGGIAWGLMLDTLMDMRGSHVISNGPHYRDWKPDHIVVPDPGLGLFTEQLAEWLVVDAGSDADRWGDVIECLPQLPTSARQAIVTALQSLVDAQTLEAAKHLNLWGRLHAVIVHHRRFADAFWALPSAELDALTSIADQLQPTEPAQLHAWLFHYQMPDLGDPSMREDVARYDEAVAERRRAAVIEIFAAGGLRGLRLLVVTVAEPWTIGVAMADAGLTADEIEVLALIETGTDAEKRLALGYLSRRFTQAGWEWLNELLEGGGLSSFQRAQLLLLTRDFPRAWEQAKAAGPEVNLVFWRNFQVYGLGRDFGFVTHVAEQLMLVDRPAATLHLLNIYLPHGGHHDVALAERIALALEAILDESESDPQMPSLSAHEFTSLFAYLQECQTDLGLARLGHLEWAFLPMLGFGARPDTLHQLMATEPAFFVEIVSTVFRPSAGNGDIGEPSPDEVLRARNGFQVLQSWRRVPALTERGSIDPVALRSWIAETRARLQAADRLKIGEESFGAVLAWAPSDADGSWPCEVVRDLLEEMQSAHVDQGIVIATLAKRGVTSRGLEEGGRQEQELGSTHQAGAELFRDRWPRTAAILRQLAESYELDARREEARAERFRTGFDA